MATRLRSSQASSAEVGAVPSLNELLDHPLPLTRKERYYTGTVLPAIVTSDNFTHLARLARLLPTRDLTIRADPDDCTVLFFTEYGLSGRLFRAVRLRSGSALPRKIAPAS